MAIIKRKNLPSKKIDLSSHPRKNEELIADKKWLSEFYSLYAGSAWNMACNWRLNDMYKEGLTPNQVFKQCGEPIWL